MFDFYDAKVYDINRLMNQLLVIISSHSVTSDQVVVSKKEEQKVR